MRKEDFVVGKIFTLDKNSTRYYKDCNGLQNPTDISRQD